MKMIIENKRIHEIPLLTINPIDILGQKPVIIMLHGASSKKENYIEKAYYMAEAGFYVIVPDAYGHGEWKKNEAEPVVRDIKEGLKFYTETSKYIDAIIESLKDNEDVDDQKVGLFGASMGAHTVFHNILSDRRPNIKVAATVNGSPVWTSAVDRYIDGIPKELQKLSDEDISKIKDYVGKIQPISKKRNINELPLLIQSGELDDRIPLDEVVKSYDELREMYSDKTRIDHRIVKGIGHRTAPEMLLNAMGWFVKHLL